MAARIREGEDELALAHEINVTPFIDVILVLLIVFMVAAPLATVDVPVDLPSSSAARQPRPEAPVYVTLKADRSLSVGDVTVTRDGLSAALAAATGDDREQRVYVRADETVAYGELMAVMDGLHSAGFLKIGLVGVETTAAP